MPLPFAAKAPLPTPRGPTKQEASDAKVARARAKRLTGERRRPRGWQGGAPVIGIACAVGANNYKELVKDMQILILSYI